MKEWFTVDTNGLRALQRGKPKTFVIREFVQNAWDEHITICEVEITHNDGKIKIIIADDSPEGFKNIENAYTLYKDTDKRKNVEQRGRFNLGNKEACSVCNYAKIITTKGMIIFDDDGRHQTDFKRDTGTIVEAELDGTEKECSEMISYAKALLVPPKIKYIVNGELIMAKKPYKIFDAILPTEIQEDTYLKKTRRKTAIHLIKEQQGKLYEMGLPVMDIDCQFGLDIQQKVPLSFDRDSVNQSFLKELYTETLNNMYTEIMPEHASDSWIRLGMAGKNISKEAISHILTARYGDKFLVANPFDKNSMDEAVAQGYRVIAGSELSKEEWANIKENAMMDSTSDLFGSNILANTKSVKPDANQQITADYATRIAWKFLHINITVAFVDAAQATMRAQYGGQRLTFNVAHLKGFFDTPISVETTELIIHELGHEAGNHTEHEYHNLLTQLGAELIMEALKNPEFFK